MSEAVALFGIIAVVTLGCAGVFTSASPSSCRAFCEPAVADSWTPWSCGCGDVPPVYVDPERPVQVPAVLLTP